MRSGYYNYYNYYNIVTKWRYSVGLRR